MTIVNPPLYLETGSYDAVRDRELIDAIFSNDGVIGASSLKVTQTTTPSMQVIVAAGQVAVKGSATGSQGTYLFTNNSPITLALSASNATNPRIDIVIARIYDSEISGVDNRASIEIITGNAAASPTIPALPANSKLIATIAVGANVSTIITANITDKRQQASLEGNTTCLSTDKPANPYLGQIIYETDTSQVRIWLATFWYALTSEWISWTPVFYADHYIAVGNEVVNWGSNAILQGKYQHDPVGKTLKFRVFVSAGGSGIYGGLGAIRLLLPETFTASIDFVEQNFYSKLFVSANTTTWVGGGYIFPGWRHLTPLFPVSVSSSIVTDFRNADSSGGTGTGVPTIPSAYALDSPPLGSNLLMTGEIAVN